MENEVNEYILPVKIFAPANITAEEAGRLLQMLIDVGKADAQRSFEEGEMDFPEDAEDVLSFEVSVEPGGKDDIIQIGQFVCQNRSDKRLPTLEKSSGLLHLIPADAEKELDKLVKEVGPYYGIYDVQIVVVRRAK